MTEEKKEPPVKQAPRLSKPMHGIGPSTPGICPSCDTAADPWLPPRQDPRFKNRIETLREVYMLASDQEAIAFHLKLAGGFICTCAKCGLTYFVPASVATIKEAG